METWFKPNRRGEDLLLSGPLNVGILEEIY